MELRAPSPAVLLVMFIIDQSLSMAEPLPGGRSTNEMLERYLPELFDLLATHKDHEVYVAAVSFNDQAMVVQDFLPVAQATCPPLAAGGNGTDVSLGAQRAMDLIDDYTDQLWGRNVTNIKRPFCVLLSDGEANRSAAPQALSELQTRVGRRKLNLIALAAEGTGGLDLLRELTHPDWPPIVVSDNGEKGAVSWQAIIDAISHSVATGTAPQTTTI